MPVEQPETSLAADALRDQLSKRRLIEHGIDTSEEPD